MERKIEINLTTSLSNLSSCLNDSIWSCRLTLHYGWTLSIVESDYRLTRQKTHAPPQH